MQSRGELLTEKSKIHVAWEEEQSAVVIAEMNRIFADPVFKNSQRCIALLRYLVETALAGNCENIKERTLGIEVFGRPVDYSPSADPVVRMAANEIRKRLAQYYQKPNQNRRVLIRLVPGSYTPEFDFEETDQIEDAGEASVQHLIQDAQSSEPSGMSLVETGWRGTSSATSRKRAIWILAVVLVAVCSLTIPYLGLFHSHQYYVWEPILSSKEDVTMCVADDLTLARGGNRYLTKQQKIDTVTNIIESLNAPPISDVSNLALATPFADAKVANDLSVWLGAHGKTTNLAPASSLKLQDFHRGPAVLIGAFDNPWTLIMLANLRFSPGFDPVSGDPWIKDAQNPTSRKWIHGKTQSTQPSVDYGVISRFLSQDTGNWILVVAGLGEAGTKAGAQLLLDPSLAASIPDIVRSKRNFQIVIKTEIINGNNGRPQIVAFQSW